MEDPQMRLVRRLRRFCLSYANVAATLALVLAMGGTAIAAHHYLITSKSQIKPSVRRALRGNSGPAGSTGVTGATGATGAANPSATTVDGETVTQIRDDIPQGQTSFTSFFSADGLTLLEECGSLHHLGLELETSNPASEANLSGHDEGPSPPTAESFNDGGSANLPGFVYDSTGSLAIPFFASNPGTNEGSGTLVYSAPSGQTVTIDLGWDWNGAFGHGLDCGVWGTAISSN